MRDRLRAVECPAEIIDQIGGWKAAGVGEGYGGRVWAEGFAGLASPDLKDWPLFGDWNLEQPLNFTSLANEGVDKRQKTMTATQRFINLDNL